MQGFHRIANKQVSLVYSDDSLCNLGMFLDGILNVTSWIPTEDPASTMQEMPKESTLVDWVIPVFQNPFFSFYTHFKGVENRLNVLLLLITNTFSISPIWTSSLEHNTKNVCMSETHL